MSSILYYSNFCEHSKKLLQSLSKTTVSKDIHFICIDKRTNEGNKIFIVLENGQKIIMPENVNRVPALLLLNHNYKVLYGEAIYQHLKPQQEVLVQQATQNNMEPMAFSFGGGGGNYGIMSDNFSFLDLPPEEMTAKGNGGIRQMHNYVSSQYRDTITQTFEEEKGTKGSKLPEGLTVEQLQQQREQEYKNMYAK